ncbi:hypothetical protein NE237_015207 [Protea cynaroides]|uniref:X8 domain-containing protein n=1 Tax=Protea cynaroides TaxID=273540 RepID=A0A9Q0KDV1_9MAGN|nr:hypothetical protein NE237_015207 [Protea cynaroides]
MMGRAAELRVVLVMVVVVLGGGGWVVEGQTWCVALSSASDQALQTALDYACGAGASCASVQSNGLCYLPNTVLSHASYAFNSYYQLNGQATGTCVFDGAATLSTTNPSYGTCVYPSSQSSAEGTTSTPTTTPASNITTPSTSTPVYGLGPSSTYTANRAAFRPSITIVLPYSLLLLLSVVILLM